ncbi:hypothetical protein L873DRAFT_1847244 [Choiromyces venosus 120613-1]|uniref:Uncharacterized protein n=1 Tax=Choiromyces venosus 120613-1 TaxID=1336337 RepID=A0A3N4J8K0_9PEZI|nr:hypothetical protein L873DRAFT_1847244 [Choiromyces venosus 120613-1]
MESVMTKKVKMITREEIWKTTPKIKPSESSLPEKSKIKSKLLNQELQVLPIELLAKGLFQEKVFSAAKPDNQKQMKIAAAKWRLIASKVSEPRTTAVKWWLVVHMEFTKLHQNIEKLDYLKLYDQILQEDQENFCPSSDGTHSDVVEVLMYPEEGDGLRDGSCDGHFEIDEDNIIENSEDSNETGIRGIYDGIEDESFLDYASEI